MQFHLLPSVIPASLALRLPGAAQHCMACTCNVLCDKARCSSAGVKHAAWLSEVPYLAGSYDVVRVVLWKLSPGTVIQWILVYRYGVYGKWG
jgi:hypothetical protein